MKRGIFLFILLLSLGLVGVAITAQPQFKVGILSDDNLPQEGIQQLADQIAKKHFGQEEGRVIVFKSVDDLLESKESVSLFIGGLAPALKFEKASQGKAIAESDETISSSIIATQSSGIKNIKDLKGYVVGVGNPNDTTGFFLPFIFLLKEGFTFRLLPKPGLTPPPRDIGLLKIPSSKDRETRFRMGRIPAIALDSKTAKGEEGRVLYVSPPAPKVVAVKSSTFPDAAVEDVKNFLFSFGAPIEPTKKPASVEEQPPTELGFKFVPLKTWGGWKSQFETYNP